jgi:hypothetical protein
VVSLRMADGGEASLPLPRVRVRHVLVAVPWTRADPGPDHVWAYDFGGSSTVVATYVAYLRRKLATYGPDVIHTQRAVGYSLRLPRAGEWPDETRAAAARLGEAR